MAPAPDPHAIANQMKAAQDEVRQIEPFTSQLIGFDVPSAYAVVHLIHETRLHSANLNQAFVWNVGTCRSDDKGETQVEDPRG